MNFLFLPDMVSFYTLPSTVVNHPTHKNIKAAYAFYNVATSVPLQELMQDALILAKNVSLTLLDTELLILTIFYSSYVFVS